MGIHRWSDLPVVRLLHASLRRYRTPWLSTMPPQSTTTQREAPEPSNTAGENFCMLLRQLAAYLYLCQLAINTSSVSYYRSCS